MDSQLSQMVDQLGQTSQNAIAQQAPLSLGASVAVTIRTQGSSSSTIEFLAQAGATVSNVGTDWIEAYVPVTLLPALADYEGVSSVETIIPPRPAVTSQGTTVHGSPVWNARGFTGAGVKVGIIDGGFDGYLALVGTELPSPVAARCYTAIGVFVSTPATCDSVTVHGTAVAEAVIDIAPDVSLYIANPSSFGDLQSTVAWMVSQGVQVINHSAAWTWDGPGDGTSPFSNSPLKSVDSSVAGGIIWVNAAGNSAKDNWIGSFTDTDADGFLEFTGGGVEGNSVFLSAGETITAQLRWDDTWGSAARDLDLALFDDSGIQILAVSANFQSGAAGQNPYENLSYTASASAIYNLAINHFSGSLPSTVQLQVFTGQALGVPVSTSSISNPAESANAGLLAVGAANWATPTIIEDFSSLGPTTDGRTKPDIVGVDRGDSATYGASAFAGTSQASPHVAGLAALVLEQFPGLTPLEVASYLKTNADPQGTVPNNTWGFGLAKLPLLAPGTPTGLSAVKGDRQATVSWTAPSADGGSSITGYTVTSNPGAQTAAVGSSTLSATVTALTNGTSYNFTVTATNAIGTSASSHGQHRLG